MEEMQVNEENKETLQNNEKHKKNCINFLEACTNPHQIMPNPNPETQTECSPKKWFIMENKVPFPVRKANPCECVKRLVPAALVIHAHKHSMHTKGKCFYTDELSGHGQPQTQPITMAAHEEFEGLCAHMCVFV